MLNTQVSDIQILALLCLQMMTNMQSQRKFFAWAKLFIPNQVTFDRTRFNRRAHQLLPVIMALRHGLTQEYAQTGKSQSLTVCLIPCDKRSEINVSKFFLK